MIDTEEEVYVVMAVMVAVVAVLYLQHVSLKSELVELKAANTVLHTEVHAMKSTHEMKRNIH